jgi:glycosyltransferase involved in cell wall biosynthesis
LMEAVSCGIPVVATAVGGNPEIVSAANGALVDAEVDPSGLASAMLAVLESPGDRRAASRGVWARKYDADKNYEDFAHELAALRSLA